MHTKLSVHHLGASEEVRFKFSVHHLEAPHDGRNEKRSWEILKILNILNMFLLNATQQFSTFSIGPPRRLPSDAHSTRCASKVLHTKFSVHHFRPSWEAAK